jgi:AcrR family transcriptional regulator
LVVVHKEELKMTTVSELIQKPEPRRPGRRERRRSETRERLFRAALELFAARGFSATKVEDITEAADVGKGTFFNYFPSKEHVLAALGEMQLGKVRSGVAAGQSGEVPVRQVLHQLAHALVEEPGRSQALVRSLLVAVLSSEPVREVILHNLGRGQELLAELLGLGQRRGEVRRDRKPAELARVFQQTIFGAMLLWSLHPPSKLAGWLDSTFDIFWSGISPKSAQPMKEKLS